MVNPHARDISSIDRSQRLEDVCLSHANRERRGALYCCLLNVGLTTPREVLVVERPVSGTSFFVGLEEMTRLEDYTRAE